jgi:hypothetical protein
VAATWQQQGAPAGLKTDFSFRPTTGGRPLAMCSGGRTERATYEARTKRCWRPSPTVTAVRSEMLMQRQLGWLVVWARNRQHHQHLPVVDVEGAVQRGSSFITLVRMAGLHLDGALAAFGPLRIHVLRERRSL